MHTLLLPALLLCSFALSSQAGPRLAEPRLAGPRSDQPPVEINAQNYYSHLNRFIRLNQDYPELESTLNVADAYPQMPQSDLLFYHYLNGYLTRLQENLLWIQFPDLPLEAGRNDVTAHFKHNEQTYQRILTHYQLSSALELAVLTQQWYGTHPMSIAEVAPLQATLCALKQAFQQPCQESSQ